MYVVLWNEVDEGLMSASFMEKKDASQRITRLSNSDDNQNIRLLTDDVDNSSPYKELYEKLYNDFVKNPQDKPVITATQTHRGSTKVK